VPGELKAIGNPALALMVDVTDRSALAPATTAVERSLGAVDIQVNNAGIAPSYAAAKGAIVQLTKSMAIELAPHNIQVNAIAPGWIETDMTAPLRDTPYGEEILMRTPAGRWGRTEEIGGTAVFLASSASDFVTGETIRVDGGYAIR